MKKIIFKVSYAVNNALWKMATVLMDISNSISARTHNPMGFVEDGLFQTGHNLSTYCDKRSDQLRNGFYRS